MAGRVGVVPEAVEAVAVVVPAGVVDDRVEANSLHRHAQLDRRGDLAADVVQPLGPRLAFGPRLGDEQRPAVAFVDLTQHVADRQVVRVRRHEQHTLGAERVVEPLVLAVVVDAEDVEVLHVTAEFGALPAGDHVPGGELRLPVALGGDAVLRARRVGLDINDRVGVDNSSRPDGPDRFDGGNRAANKLGLEFNLFLSQLLVSVDVDSSQHPTVWMISVMIRDFPTIPCHHDPILPLENRQPNSFDLDSIP